MTLPTDKPEPFIQFTSKDKKIVINNDGTLAVEDLVKKDSSRKDEENT